MKRLNGTVRSLSFKVTITFLIVTGLPVFIINSCIEKFDYVSPSDERYLVVDGIITQKNTIHKLNLNYSTYYGSLSPPKVMQAKVRLYDEYGNYEDYVESEKGVYYLYGNQIERNPGTAYFIEIQLKNGKVYHSHPQTMPGILKPDSLYVEREIVNEITESGTVIEKNQLKIQINTPIKENNQPYYFIWRSNHVYSLTEVQCHPLVYPKVCYVEQPVNPEQINIFSSENLDDQPLRDFEVGRIYIEPFWQFYEKHFYNVGQFSITEETYQYWETVKKIAFPTGSIFDTPPAPIRGNVYNVNDPGELVLGYFEVSAVDTIRTWTNYSFFKPMYIYDRCNDLYLYQAFNDPACCNCLYNLDDATTTRPHYWGE